MQHLQTALGYVREHRTKLLKFVAVTGGSVVAGQLVLAAMLYLLDWPFVRSNMLAAALMVMPNYLANRYWVWGKRTKNSFRTEVMPFWVLAVLGFAASTLAVWFVQEQGWPRWAALLANLLAYGVVWVVKFFVLEHFLFGANDGEVADAQPEHVTA